MFTIIVIYLYVTTFALKNIIFSLSYNQIGGVYMDNPGALLPLIWTWNRRKSPEIITTIESVCYLITLLINVFRL